MGKCDNCPINYRDFSSMSSQLPQKPVKVVKGDSTGLRHHVLRFNTPRTVRLDSILGDNVSMTRIVTENQITQPEMNLEGEGSEFGWKSKQARLAHKYKVRAVTEDQCPWELKDRNDKHYVGRKEGGITANSSYIVMRETQPGVYEAYPVEDWFTFTPKIDYTTFDEEEAEEEFLKRNKTFNNSNMMLQKRLRDNLGAEKEYEEAQLKVHDADDLFGDSDDANEDLGDDPAKKRKKNMKKFRKNKEKDEEDLNKERDDEDQYDAHASKEVDYISESDSDDSVDLTSEKPNTVSRKEDLVDKVDGRLYRDANDSDSEEEETSEMKKLLLQQGEDESGSDVDENSEEFKALMLKNKTNNIAAESKRERSSTPTSNGKEPPSKKQKLEKSDGSILTEENVWRYLARKPISTKELISKFKSKRSGLNKQDMVAKLSSILKKLAKQFMKDGKNYFVLKDEYKNLYKE